MCGWPSNTLETRHSSRSFARRCASECGPHRSWTNCSLRAMWRMLIGACGVRGAGAKQIEEGRNTRSGELGRPGLGPLRDVALEEPAEVLEAGRHLPAATRDLTEIDRHHGILERMHRDAVAAAGRDRESRNDRAAYARLHHRDLRLEVVEHHVRRIAAAKALQVTVDELLDRINGPRTDQAPRDDVLPAQPPRRPAGRLSRRLDHHQREAEKRDAAHAADRSKETAQAEVDLPG